jgi:asparagine synthetase B (glutamine-hydrolysing)
MGTPDGWRLTYNGEVFNHLALREELPGTAWRGGSDTETLLEALRRWGDEAPARLNGLFAFAALDPQRGELLLVRDRLGVKPLYTARHAGAFWFASELRALLAAGVPARPRRELMHHALVPAGSRARTRRSRASSGWRPARSRGWTSRASRCAPAAGGGPADLVDAERARALRRLSRREQERSSRTRCGGRPPAADGRRAGRDAVLGRASTPRSSRCWPPRSSRASSPSTPP